eukprot:CAMPEP_0114109830 /NCGR_PEP_ID=MMETSP0043_2-20121206/982_1 /TAXON_ID=464988 /ORGANISM="Hemiselmis andersenii, Strain CCMP644" /LENGTH=90 /DNA_ID=CAMNT_0001201727 /DNA_START=356 /DNA_END=624 /DNA_ORIENTATION=+
MRSAEVSALPAGVLPHTPPSQLWSEPDAPDILRPPSTLLSIAGAPNARLGEEAAAAGAVARARRIRESACAAPTPIQPSARLPMRTTTRG